MPRCYFSFKKIESGNFMIIAIIIMPLSLHDAV
jgi:hypothetical protein